MERDRHQLQVCFRQLLTLSLPTIRLREQLKQGADETIYAGGMVNIQASQNASQQVQWHKETTANKRSATQSRDPMRKDIRHFISLRRQQQSAYMMIF